MSDPTPLPDAVCTCLPLNRKLMAHLLGVAEGSVHEQACWERAARSAPSLDEETWPDRAWLIAHWVNHRCGYVDCRSTEQHEHGGGQPMREMTPDERARIKEQP